MDIAYPPPATTGRMNGWGIRGYIGEPSIGQCGGLVKRRRLGVPYFYTPPHFESNLHNLRRLIHSPYRQYLLYVMKVMQAYVYFLLAFYTRPRYVSVQAK